MSAYDDPFIPHKAKHKLGRQHERLVEKERKKKEVAKAKLIHKMKEIEEKKRRANDTSAVLISSTPTGGTFDQDMIISGPGYRIIVKRG